MANENENIYIDGISQVIDWTIDTDETGTTPIIPVPIPVITISRKTLYQLIWEVLGRLNDTNRVIWSEAEIESYIKTGYELLCSMTLCLWKKYSLNDVAGIAVYDLPDDFYQMDRVTNNYRKLIPAFSTEMEINDYRYQLTQGQVDAYIMDKDGVGKIRLYRVPSISAESSALTATGTWGLLRIASDITTDTLVGSWGVARIIKQDQIATGTWGILRKATTINPALNTVIEYFYRPPEMTVSDVFELPDPYIKYIRHYAMYRAFGREGPGKEDNLSKHYYDRFNSGISLMKNRAASIDKQRISQLGGSQNLLTRPPRPKLPWNYGTMSTR
jgi:hypothetical protein